MPSRESDSGEVRVDVAGPTALGDAVAATRRYASDSGLRPRDEARLCVIVEELITNMIEHGSVDPEAPIRIGFARAGSCVAVSIEDEGPSFDPRHGPGAGNIPDRGGGAGLRLVAAWSEIVGYESSDGRNRIEFRMPLSGR